MQDALGVQKPQGQFLFQPRQAHQDLKRLTVEANLQGLYGSKQQAAVEEIEARRADPLLIEQELDVRPEVADALERATGRRAGRVYWRSAHDHLYALELADLGRARPSMATVYGFWERWEPRPPEEEIDADLLDLCLWVAAISPGIEPADVTRVAERAGMRPGVA
jgi:hypothetical protein